MPTAKHPDDPSHSGEGSRWQAILDHVHHGVALYETIRDDRGAVVDFRVTWLNAAACRDLGARREALVGRRLSARTEDAEALSRTFREVVETARPREVTGPRGVALHVEPHDGGVLTTWRAISETARSGADPALLRDHEIFREVYHNAATGIVIATRDMRMQQCNPAYSRLVGYTEEELRALDVAELVHPDDRAANVRELHRLLRGEIPSFEIENRYVHKSGRAVWVHKFVSLLRDESGAPSHVLALVTDITARRAAEQGRRESEERLRFALDATGVGLWVLDLDSGAATRNLRHDQIFGYDAGRSDWSWDVFLAHVHPDDRAAVDRSYGEALRACRDWETECRIVRVDGACRWIWARVAAPKRVEGEPRRLIGILMDITDRKRVRQQAERHHAQLRAVYDAMEDGLLVFDANGEVVLVNEAEARMFGYASAEEMKRDLAYFAEVFEVAELDGTALPVDQWPVSRVLRGEALSNLVLRARRRDTGQAWVIGFSGEPAVEPGGDQVLAVIVSRDVTEQMRDQQALRESEERLRLAAEAAGFGTYDLEVETGRSTWSDRLEEIVGIRSAGADDAYRALLARVHPDDLDGFAAAHARAFDPAGDGEVDHEFRLVGQDREVRWLRVAGRVFFTGSGVSRRPARAIGTVLDVTQRRQAEEALREADRRKDEFLATLAHELRNPLAPMRTAVQVLERHGSADPVVHRIRDIISRQVHHMVRLIDDLLDVSRITRGKLELRIERTSVADVVSLALETSRPHVEAAAHTLTVSLPEEPIALDADPVRLAQVLSNLLNNAARYTEPGGRIWLDAERCGDWVEISVRDTGIGIRSEDLPRLFDLFAQVDTGGHSHGGLGIGLSLARGLVQMHGGTIGACSEGPGHGSTFVLRLPTAAAATPAHEAAQAGPAPAAATDRRILVVDDNVDNAEALALLLRLEGNDVHVAHDGVAAVEAASRLRPDVILLDIGMPRMDGYEACRRIRALPWGRDVCILALTGWGADADRRRSQEAGFDGHLVKPVDPDAVIRAITGDRSG